MHKIIIFLWETKYVPHEVIVGDGSYNTAATSFISLREQTTFSDSMVDSEFE